jgi:hypothetical protein
VEPLLDLLSFDGPTTTTTSTSHTNPFALLNLGAAPSTLALPPAATPILQARHDGSIS